MSHNSRVDNAIIDELQKQRQDMEKNNQQILNNIDDTLNNKEIAKTAPVKIEDDIDDTLTLNDKEIPVKIEDDVVLFFEEHTHFFL